MLFVARLQNINIGVCQFIKNIYGVGISDSILNSAATDLLALSKASASEQRVADGVQTRFLRVEQGAGCGELLLNKKI